MTTTAEYLATLGLTMDDARSIVDSLLPDNTEALISGCQYFGITGAMLGDILGFVPGDFGGASLAAGYSIAIDFVIAGEVDALIDLCEYMGITASQLGATVGMTAAELRTVLDSYFGVDSSDLPGSVPDPVVSAVSSPSANEGGELDFEVTLSGATLVETRYDFTPSGDLGEVASFTISNGVSLDFSSGPWQLVVPAGVSSFTFTLATTADDEDTTDESITMTIGGQAGAGVIHDDDTEQAPGTLTLLPEDMTELAGILRLNGQTGELATANLRAEVIAQTNETDYWTLFDSSVYVEAADGWFTGAEIGWELTHIPATDEMVESLFYGTLIHALKAVDEQEFMEIGTFVYFHYDQFSDPATFAQLIDLLVAAFEDSAAVPYLSDAEIHGAVVEAGVELVGMVEYQPSIFHAVVNSLA